MASYLSADFFTDEYLTGHEGRILEQRELVIYYTRQGDTVTLSRNYT